MINKPPLYKPIFIIGLHRTGSTLLKNILGQNSQLAMATDEMHLYSPWRNTFSDHIKKIGPLDDESKIEKLMDAIFSGRIYGTFWKDYPTLGIDRDKIKNRITNSDKKKESIVAIILDEYRRLINKPRVGVKYPIHFSKARKLYQWFPDCKIIFLTRDVRAICASKVNDEATKSRKQKLKSLSFMIHYFTILFFSLEYVWSSKVFKRSMPDAFLLRYEDLVTNPQLFIENLCKYCEIPFEPEMLEVIGKPSSFSNKKINGIDKSRISTWKNHLSNFDSKLISILTMSSLSKFGYNNSKC